VPAPLHPQRLTRRPPERPLCLEAELLQDRHRHTTARTGSCGPRPAASSQIGGGMGALSMAPRPGAAKWRATLVAMAGGGPYAAIDAFLTEHRLCRPASTTPT
jgi:hypothetical protein